MMRHETSALFERIRLRKFEELNFLSNIVLKKIHVREI